VKTLRLLLDHHLSPSMSSLRDLDRERDIVLMVEALDQATDVPHHQQKLILRFSAMRHFAEALREQGITVDYVALDAPDNTGALGNELRRAVVRHKPDHAVVSEPASWRLAQAMADWQKTLPIGLDIRSDDRFLCSRETFHEWAEDRQALRMEHFYRWMRRRTGWLMDGGKPEGGRWSFDRENRHPLPQETVPSEPSRFRPDRLTQGVIQLVETRFAAHFGVARPFAWAVTRE
jgi:deoxyribodipyrimidine photolyase-related protein